MAVFKETLFAADSRMPWLFTRCAGTTAAHELVANERALIYARLLEHGAIVLRGYEVGCANDFAAFVAAIRLETLLYRYRSTPRTARGQGIYSATEYPAAREIPLHNENAYQRIWPAKLAFCCLQPAAQGGATPLADMRKVREHLDPAIFDEFARRGVRYVRVFHGHTDLSWQESFQTDERAVVETYCLQNAIQWEWLQEDVLRTAQTCPGVIQHPQLAETFLFNQAHLFHPSALGAAALEHLLEAFGRELLPRNAFFGDGGEIPAAMLDAVRGAFVAAALDLQWQQGDIALIDNIQVAHGRRAYTGERHLLTALLEPSGFRQAADRYA